MSNEREAELCKQIQVGNPQVWLIAHGRSNVGKVRSENQDRLLLEELPDLQGAVAMVADGMGGHTGGSQAAQIAVDTIRKMLLATPPQVNLYEQIRDCFAKADLAIRNVASQDAQVGNMGTTGVAALLLPEETVHIYTGDSRLYHFRDGQEVYRTKDHSVVRYLEEEGLLSEEEARNHPMRSRLTSSLGGGPQERKLLLDPSWNTELPAGTSQPSILSLAAGDVILICSDGLCGEISSPQLHEIVKTEHESMENLTQLCVNAALEAGGRDNVTVIAIKILSQPGL